MAGLRVGLARVSTKKDTQDISIEGQVADLERAGCDLVLAERASAFLGRKRPAWERLWALVASGQVGEVVVIDQSRLSRKGEDMEFLAACARQGVTVRALSGGPIEIESYMGFVSAGFMSLMNQAASRLISAKVKGGLERRREAGFLATGKVPFGYAHIEGHAAPDPVEFPRARRMFEGLMAMDMQLSAWIRSPACGDTGRSWTRTGIRRWLAHPMLRGQVRGLWGAVEPLISQQEHEMAERLLAARRTMRGRSAPRTHCFSGLVHCGRCGKALHHQRDGKTMRLKCKTLDCGWYGRSVREAVVRECVIRRLRDGAAAAMAELGAPEAPRESAEAQALRGRIEQLRQLAEAGVPNLAEAIDALVAQLHALSAEPSGPRLDYLAALLQLPGTLELTTATELRAITIEFVEAITYPGNSRSVEVRLR